MNNPYEGKDGLARDIAKLKHRYGPWKGAMLPHWVRWKKRPFPHETTNLCTESGRADAYFNGHIMTVYLHLSVVWTIGLLGLLIWRW